MVKKTAPTPGKNRRSNQTGSKSRSRRRARSVERPAGSGSMTAPSAAGYSVKRLPAGLMSVGASHDLGEMVFYLGEFVQPTTTLTAQVYQVTPALFPRLAQLARCWAKYRFLRFEPIYLPSCGTSTTGMVELGFLYSFRDATPTSTEAMTASSGFTTASVWGGKDGASLLSHSSPPPKNSDVVMSAMNCPNQWYNYTSVTPESSEPPALTDTYIPARFIARSDLVVSSENRPGKLWVRVRIVVRDPVNPVDNV
nr:capsid protein [Cynosurus mottle virus]WMX25432.1 capsid protein [Cynosurus mottle virus]